MRRSGFFRDLPYRHGSLGGLGSGAALVRDAVLEADPGRRAIVASYLSGGTAISRVPGRARDVFDDGKSVSLDIVTDGEWVWPLDAAHYCECYGVLPEPGLVGRAFEQGGLCPPVADASARRIAREFFSSVSK